MRVELTLPIKAFSVNAYHFATKRIKTKEARAWEELFLQCLEEHKELHDMALQFNEQGGKFHVKISARYPSQILYNKSGALSIKAFDCDNIIKPIIDLVFNKFMSVNDQHIEQVISRKEEGPMHSIELCIELLPL